MHKLAEKIADCMKAKVEAKGIDNIEGQDLAELGMWTDIIKDLVCYDKDKKIIEAMDEAEESEEAMKYIEMYEDYPERKGYRGQRRDSRGRYMSRRGYEAPMMMHDEDWEEMQRNRDLDRKSMNRMYYSGSVSDGGMTSGGSRGYSDGRQSESGSMANRSQQTSRYDNARRNYTETKQMGKSSGMENKQENMKNLEEYMKELSSDVTDMIADMDASEKQLLKQKMQVLMQKIG